MNEQTKHKRAESAYAHRDIEWSGAEFSVVCGAVNEMQIHEFAALSLLLLTEEDSWKLRNK